MSATLLPGKGNDRSRPLSTEEKGRRGHRGRLRARFQKGGENALQDYELLEMLLFNAVQRRDVKTLAKQLLRQRKNMNGVLSIEKPELLEILKTVKGIGEGSADRIINEFSLCRAVAARLVREDIVESPLLSSWRAVVDYAVMRFGHSDVEKFCVLFLNSKNRLIADEVLQQGTINHTPVYPREVVKRALNLGSSAMVLVHNHPSGDTTPSRADIEMTRSLIAIASPLDIHIHDHLIVGRGTYTSFKERGLL